MIKRASNHKSGDVTEGYIVPQIDAMRPVFEKVSEGFFEYANPGMREEFEKQDQADKDLEGLSRKDRKKLAKKVKPAQFPDRGETEIVTPGNR